MRPWTGFVVAVASASSVFVTTRAAAAPIPEEMIRAAIERGVAALRKTQASDGRFAGTIHGCGPTALAALTLLECGVSPNDEQVRKAVELVRRDVPELKSVYNLALAIMLLDRLGEPADIPVIQALGVRLLEGQAPEGGWEYFTNDPSQEEAQRLRTLQQQRVDLRTQTGDSKPSSKPPLDPELMDRLRRIESRGTGRAGLPVDNSNTQFALLGVWIARRNGVPCEFALRRAEAYFRASHVRGLWTYRPGTEADGKVANTCSGLLGLAMAYGIAREAQLRTAQDSKGGKPPPPLRDPLKDPLVQIAMTRIGAEVGALVNPRAEPNPYRDLYFLWSVERVGMVYSVAMMGGVDWYQVGSLAILRSQTPSGMWSEASSHLAISAEINTCFALLFLRRSDFAHDLSSNLRNKNSKTTLRSGDEKPNDVSIPIPEPSESERLALELPSAATDRQTAIIAELRDRKGPEYTDAISQVIPKLTGETQRKARNALAERLARMTPDTIRGKLKDANNEVRRAAALACSMKDDKSYIGDLIATLDDKDAWVVRAAAVSLRALTGQDFGPTANATADERAKAVAAWKAWWKRQSGS